MRVRSERTPRLSRAFADRGSAGLIKPLSGNFSIRAWREEAGSVKTAHGNLAAPARLPAARNFPPAGTGRNCAQISPRHRPNLTGC